MNGVLARGHGSHDGLLSRVAHRLGGSRMVPLSRRGILSA